MAIWNNTYIHGILDADDGYYVTPYHYGVASYSEDEGAIVFGDSRIDTIIDGDSVAINNDLMVDNTINAQKYKIITPIGLCATLASFDNNNINYGKCIIIGDPDNANTVYIEAGHRDNGQIVLSGGYNGTYVIGNLHLNSRMTSGGTSDNIKYDILDVDADSSYVFNNDHENDHNNETKIIFGSNDKGQKTIIKGANIDIIARYSDHTLGNIDASYGNFIISNCRLSAEGSTFNLAKLDISTTDYNVNISDVMDSNNGAARTVNTKINGDRVLFANSCYGTDDPPTNGKEGQIYFKIVS